MKYTITFLALLTLSGSTFAQQAVHITAIKTVRGNDYLLKSRHQKTAAWILLGSGAVLIATSFAIPEGEETGGWNPYSGADHKNDGIKAAFLVAGTASALASIPFFILAQKNKRKAMSSSVILKMEKTVARHQGSATPEIFPAAGIQINIR